jgi:hypothetical protein
VLQAVGAVGVDPLGGDVGDGGVLAEERSQPRRDRTAVGLERSLGDLLFLFEVAEPFGAGVGEGVGLGGLFVLDLAHDPRQLLLRHRAGEVPLGGTGALEPGGADQARELAPIGADGGVELVAATAPHELHVAGSVWCRHPMTSSYSGVRGPGVTAPRPQ